MGTTMIFKEGAPKSQQHSSSEERPPEAPGQLELKLESTQSKRQVRILHRRKSLRLLRMRVRKLGTDRRDDLPTVSKE